MHAGPTVLADQLFDNDMQSPCPPEPQCSTLILPAANSLAVFDGRLAHGVLSSQSMALRATLLVNWWTAQPQVQGRRQDRAAGQASHLTVLCCRKCMHLGMRSIHWQTTGS